MPKRLRYTQVLGLNARGLTRGQKRQIVWKREVKGKLNLKANHKTNTSNKKKKSSGNAVNEYWDKYHQQLAHLESNKLKLTQYLQAPWKLKTVAPHQKRRIVAAVQSAQSDIERLQCKYSMSIPDKKSLQILTMLGKLHGIVQFKTSNHCTGYWAHLLSQRNVKCKVFDVSHAANENGNKQRKQKKKKKKDLGEESNALWHSVVNVDSVRGIAGILKDQSKNVLLMIYPDFVVKNEEQNSDVNADDNENVSVECLRCFTGNFVVHIGELFGCTFDANHVWGRTTSQQFQMELNSRFHKVYQHEMQRWPLFRDTLSVWKRNKCVEVEEMQTVPRMIQLNETEKNDSFHTPFWNNLFNKAVFGNDKTSKKQFAASTKNNMNKPNSRK